MCTAVACSSCHHSAQTTTRTRYPHSAIPARSSHSSRPATALQPCTLPARTVTWGWSRCWLRTVSTSTHEACKASLLCILRSREWASLRSHRWHYRHSRQAAELHCTLYTVVGTRARALGAVLCCAVTWVKQLSSLQAAATILVATQLSVSYACALCLCTVTRVSACVCGRCLACTQLSPSRDHSLPRQSSGCQPRHAYEEGRRHGSGDRHHHGIAIHPAAADTAERMQADAA